MFLCWKIFFLGLPIEELGQETLTGHLCRPFLAISPPALFAGWTGAGQKAQRLGFEMGLGGEGLSCFSFCSSADDRPSHLLCGHLCRSGKTEAPDPGRALPRPSSHSHPPGSHNLCRFFCWHGGLPPRQPDAAENRKALFHNPWHLLPIGCSKKFFLQLVCILGRRSTLF